MIKSRFTASITDKPWWLAGGIPRDACVAAYQPIGASDYAASKVNLANPGTYTATDGTEYPTWTSMGWVFNGNTQYLSTTIVPSDKFSVILKYSNANNAAASVALSSLDTSPANCYFELNPSRASAMRFLYGDQVATIDGGYKAAGVMAMTSEAGYFDGSYIISIPAYTWNGSDTVIVLGVRNQNGTINYFQRINIQAVAFYIATLTAYQVAALTNTMNAL